MLLAIDTSTSYASIALVTPEQTIAELSWVVGQRHSTELLQRLDALLAAHNIAPDQLERIAVALGPGSFNGVRVALATAKSLAFAPGIPLHGVPTLDVIAWGHAICRSGLGNPGGWAGTTLCRALSSPHIFRRSVGARGWLPDLDA